MTDSIVVENLKEGTPREIWDAPMSDQIEGFATDISVNHGTRVDFKINVNAAPGVDVPYHVEIYRLGYYDGDGARLVHTVNGLTGNAQPDPLTDQATGLVDAGNWNVSTGWDVPADAVSGVYLVKLVRDDNGATNQIPFIVRNDDGPKSDILLQTSDTTWHAYNGWAGNNGQVGGNFYGDPSGTIDHPDIPGSGSFAQDRAYAVSYNRPFITRDAGGAAAGAQDYLFGADYAAIYWLEKNGYDVSYISGVDTDRLGADYLIGHQAYISVGHDEYWSGEQRHNVEEARDAGVNLLFWSGNEVYWKVRYEDAISPDGTPYRTLVCYKETWANGDPNAGPEDYANIDPAHDWTGTWRDMRFVDAVDAEGNLIAGGSRVDLHAISGSLPNCNCITGAGPENSLTGQLFGPDGTGQFGAALDVPAALAGLRVWRDTTVAETGQLDIAPGILGYEWNTSPEDELRPAGLIKLSDTVDIPWSGILVDQGNHVQPGVATHNLSLYRAESGALVFGAGTVFWSWGLSDEHDSSPYGATISNLALQQFTVNMFADMGIHPQVSDVILASQGLVRATASTDFAAATTTMDIPDNVAALQTVTITGTATDNDGNPLTEDGQVAVVEVSVDGGANWRVAEGTANWTFNWRPTAEGTYTIKARAIDDSLNIAAITPSQETVTVTAAIAPDSFSVFDPLAPVPGASFNENQTVELGMKFTADRAGEITELRYYRSASDAGDTDVREGHLWRASDGALLGTVTFTSDTGESGWQIQSLDTPIAILPGVEYIVSYRTADNYFAANGFFAPSNEVAFDGVDDDAFTDPFGVLSAPQNSVIGDAGLSGNGVYRPAAPGDTGPVMPNQTFQSSNYWADVTFVPAETGPNTSPTITSNGGGPTATVNVAENTTVVTTFSAADAEAPPQVLTYVLSGEDAELFQIVGNQIRFVDAPDFEDLPDDGITDGYQVTLGVSDGEGGADSQDITVNVTNLNEGSLSSLFAPTEAPATFITEGQDSTDYELGVKFQTAQTGAITALRYFRGAVDADDTDIRTLNLWEADGDLLGSVTITSGLNEIGWQVGTLAAPITIQANTVYIASYGTTENYAFTGGYFTTTRSGPDGILTAPESGSVGGNGVFNFQQGPGFFPTGSFNASNYWVDVAFEPLSAPNTPPQITSNGGGDTAAIPVFENSTLVTILTATDADVPVQALSFAKIGGEDSSLFEIVNGNELRLVSPPDFENLPAPGATPGYQVSVQVADGNGGFDQQDITVSVEDVSENPAAGFDGKNLRVDYVFGSAPGVPATFTGSTKFITASAAPGTLDVPNIPDPGIGNGPFGLATVDFGTASIRIEYPLDATAFPEPVVNFAAEDTHPYNGVLITDTTNTLPAILGVTISQQAGFTIPLDSGNISFTADSIFVNVNDLGDGISSTNSRQTDVDPVASGRQPSFFTLDINFNAPVAVADTLSATEDTPLTYTAAELLGNDTDVENSALSIASVTSGTGGTAVLNVDGTVTFTPAANFNGAANFTYTISDGSVTSAPATVTVNVAPDAVPTAQAGTLVAATVEEDGMDASVPATEGLNGIDRSTGHKDLAGDDNNDDEASGAGNTVNDLTNLFSPGPDGPLSISLNLDAGNLPTLFSKGAPVLYTLNGTTDTLTAYVEVGAAGFDPLVDRTVFTLHVNPNGSWSFDLDDQLDHVSNQEGAATALQAAVDAQAAAAANAAAATVFQEGFDSAAIVNLPNVEPELASSEKWGPQTQYYLPAGFGFDSFTLPPGWTFDGLTVLAVNPANGDKAIGLNEVPGHGSATKAISGFTPGVEYVLTFDHWGDDQPNTNSYDVDVKLDDTVIAHVSRSYSTPGPGVTASFTFTATSITHSLTFLDVTNDGPASALIDNIKIVNAGAAAALATANAELAAAQIAYDNALAEENSDLRTDGTPVDSIDFSSLIVATDTNGDSVTGALPGSFVIAVQDDIPAVNQVQVITFENITPPLAGVDGDNLINEQRPIPNGFGGFNWQVGSQFNVYKHFPGDDPGTPPFPLMWETHSGEVLAKPDSNNTVGSPVIIQQTDGSDFSFLGAWFSTAFVDNVQITLQAFNNASLVGSEVITVNTGGPVFFDFTGDPSNPIDFGSFADIDELRISSPEAYTFDDFTFIDSPAYFTDNIPVIIADEDDLDTPPADFQGNDDLPADSPGDDDALHQTGTLGFLVGADEPVSVDFSSMTGTVMDMRLPSQPVTSGGVTLKYFWKDTSNTLYATKAATASDASDLNSAFKIHIDDLATGAYTFTLLQRIDHPLTEASDPPGSAAYEDNIDISLTYTVTDADGDAATGTVRVSIDDDVPVISTLGPTQVDELQAITGTWTLATGADGVSSVDVTVGATTQTLSLALPTNTVTFSDGLPGVLTINANLTWNFVANAVATEQSVTFSLSATDGDGDSTSSAQLTVTVTPVNEFSVTTPVDTDATANAVSENVAIGTLVGVTAFASDADATNNAVTYSLSANPGGLFAIDPATGVVTTAAAIDREALGPSTSIEVTATSADGSSAAQTFSIDVTNVLGITVNGTPGANLISGTGEEDTLNGFGGSDLILGLDGNDTINAGSGNDIQVGGAGNDTFLIAGTEAQGDTFDGGSGNDAIQVAGSGAATMAGFNATTSSIEIWQGDGQGVLGTSANNTFNLSGLTAMTGLAFIDGNGGNDIITGSSFADDLRGGSGNDTLNGGDDNDTLTGGSGNDTQSGGDGNDTFVIAGTDGQNDAFDGGLGTDSILATGSGPVTLAGFNALASSIETWRGSGQGLRGTSANNSFDLAALIAISGLLYVDGNGGNDIITGSSFADDLRGGSGNDTLTGGDGDDTLTGGAGNDTLHGGNDNDTIVVSGTDGQNDIVDGGLGIDSILATGSGAVTLAGFDATSSSIETWQGNGQGVLGTGAANTFDFSGLTTVSGLAFVNGGGGNDSITGSSFDDDLRGGSGNDTLNGGEANDTLTGGAGSDTLHGGNGNDTFVISGTDGQNDIFDGGLGTDRIQVTGSGAVTLAGFDATASSIETWQGNGQGVLGTGAANTFDFSGLTTVNGLAFVDGGGGNDIITGSGFADGLRGGTGNDTLTGGEGGDTLTGGGGNDALVGGHGADTLNAGSGNDVIAYQFANEGGDLIQGFNVVADTIQISASGFGGNLVAGQSLVAGVNFIANTAPTPNSGSEGSGVFLYDTDDLTLTFDQDGSDVGAAAALAEFDTAVNLQANDFDIVA
jgi:Ca2+-binding RTX toxin-like protein